MVEEGDRPKYDPRPPAGARPLARPAARPLPAPPLPAGRVSAHDNPLDHAVYQDWRRLTWAYCDVAPGTRAGRVLVRRLGFEFEFECAAKNVTTLRQMI